MDDRGGIATWIFAMVVAGLIVALIVSPQFREAIGDFFGGEGDSGPEPTASISDLVSNPENYNGSIVTVEGEITVAQTGGEPGGFFPSLKIWEGNQYLEVLNVVNGDFSADVDPKVRVEVLERIRVTGIFRTPQTIEAQRVEPA